MINFYGWAAVLGNILIEVHIPTFLYLSVIITVKVKAGDISIKLIVGKYYNTGGLSQKKQRKEQFGEH